MPKERSKMDPTIIAALIGLAGVVITALLSSPLLLNLVQRTSAPPTSTLARPTETVGISATPPILTEVATSSIPTPAPGPGQDFREGCINSSNWGVYSDKFETLLPGAFLPDARGCWPLSDWGMSAQTKGLLLLLTAPPTNEKNAIFTPISKNVDIDFVVQIDSLSTTFDKVGNIAFGIVPTDGPKPLDGTFLLFQIESSQPNAPLYLKIRNQGAEDYIDNRKYKLHEVHQFSFHLEDISLVIYLDNNQITDPIKVPSKHSFWIGYTLPSGGNLSAVISNLSIQSR